MGSRDLSDHGPRTFDLTRGEFMYRLFDDGHYGIAGDRRFFDNASFPEGEVSAGLSIDESSSGFKLDRELLSQPRRGDRFVILTEELPDPVTIEIDLIQDDPTTDLPYFEAHGHLVQNRESTPRIVERPLMIEKHKRDELMQAISDFGPVVGLNLGKGELTGSLKRLRESLSSVVQSRDSELGKLGNKAL